VTSARRRRMPTRTLYAAGLLTAALAVLLGAWFLSGWADVRAQQRELAAAPARDAARTGTELATELRAELSRVMSRELERPYFHYQNLMHDPRTSGVWGVAPSPLAAGPEDPLVLGYFQLDPKGGVTTPTINDAFPELSESRRLAEHRRFRDEVTRDLAALLTPKGETTGVLVAEAAPVKKPRPVPQQKVAAQVIEIDPNSYVQNYSGNANEVYQQQRATIPENIELNNNDSNVPVTNPRANPRNAPLTQSTNPSTRNQAPSQSTNPSTGNQVPSQTTNPSTRNQAPSPTTNRSTGNQVPSQQTNRAPTNQVPSQTTNPSTGNQVPSQTTNPTTRNQPSTQSTNPSTRNQPSTQSTNPSTRTQAPSQQTNRAPTNQVPSQSTNPSTGNQPPTQSTNPSTRNQAPNQQTNRAPTTSQPTNSAETNRAPTNPAPTDQAPTNSPSSRNQPPGPSQTPTTGSQASSPTTASPPMTAGASPQPPKPKPKRPKPKPVPEPVEEPKPITITISPLEWRTYMFAGAPTLVAVREVDTPDGMLAQGFVVDRSVVTSWLATRAGESVAELKTDEQAPTAAEVAPGWRLAVSANPRALVEAAADAAGVANGFLLRFVLVGVIAALALAFVVSLVARAERLARERSQFAAAAAHELRTPLAGLQLYGDMLADGLGDPSKMRDYARRMSEEASRLGRVVSNVLGFSQLERGNLSVEPRSGNLGHELCELAERAQPALDRAGAVLELEVPPDLTASFDRDALARIIGNLLDNAEKYGRDAEDRTIGLTAREIPEAVPEAVEVVVSDHGPGVTQDARSRLFRPFTRGVSADGPAGLGLGLALSQSLARAMGGELEYRPTSSGGASFVLRLPR
jgi:signal transduction histidine kinase